MLSMKGIRHSDEQVRRKIREAQTALLGGATIVEVCRQLTISEATYHRWKRKFAAADGQPSGRRVAKEDLSKRLKELERENKRLKQLVGQLTLDNAILKDALEVRHRG